jgi:hypothetical protein
LFTQASAANTWTFQHNLGTQYPSVNVFDSNNNLIIPTTVNATYNIITVTFGVPTSGYIVATVGGGLPTISASYANYVLQVNSTGVSASWQPFANVNVTSASYALTASYALSSSQAVSSSFSQTASFALNVPVTASYAISASQAITSSFALTASYVASVANLSTFQIASGSVTASVNVNSGSFSVTSGSSNFFFISSSGNIGIGTTTPTSYGSRVLHVHNAAASVTFLKLSNSTTGTGLNNGLEVGNSGTTAYLYNRENAPLILGTAGNDRVTITGAGLVGIGKSSPNTQLDILGSTLMSGSLTVSGSVFVTGSISVSGSIINSLTASYAVNADTLDGTHLSQLINTSSFGTYTASINATIADILIETASINLVTASLHSYTASLNAKTSSFATTGSNTFTGNQIINGTITAQTLVVQTVSSSIEFVTGSTKFGSLLTNTHQFTGSVTMTGSLAVNGSNVILTNQTSSMSVLSSSFAQSASYARSASYADNLTVNGVLNFNNTLTDYATVGSSIVGSNNLFTRATSSYTSVFVNYTAAKGTSARSGQLMVVWNNGIAQFTDNSTLDVGGDTGYVTMSAAIVTNQVQVNAQTNSSGWVIKSMATYM